MGFFIRNVTRIARVTGSIINGENFPSPNNTATKWNVGGTDLGIIWEMQPGKYGIFFGDTLGMTLNRIRLILDLTEGVGVVMCWLSRRIMI